MTTQEFRNEVIRISLKGVDKEPDAWITFNDALHTKVLKGICSNKGISLMDDELPILECILDNSYLLVTTERIISIKDDSYDEALLEDFDRFTNDNAVKNFTQNTEGRYPKTNTFTLKKHDGTKLSYTIDSYYPASFSMILISNIISYKSLGKWFLNPK